MNPILLTWLLWCLLGLGALAVVGLLLCAVVMARDNRRFTQEMRSASWPLTVQEAECQRELWRRVKAGKWGSEAAREWEPETLEAR